MSRIGDYLSIRTVEQVIRRAGAFSGISAGKIEYLREIRADFGWAVIRPTLLAALPIGN
jgi:hypothetical protein